MKSKLAQIVSQINKFDYRQIKLAFFVLILAVSFLQLTPYDGGGGPI
ncbi:MAG TPA: hypothetical protein VLA72_20430 [Anaerolineales bacterium]|nr:hypothetical protein [Anaerolineales bacterium]